MVYHVIYGIQISSNVSLGSWVCSDEDTRDLVKMDVARFMIRTKSSMVLNESFNVEVNKHVYGVKLVEDMHGPKRLVVLKESKEEEYSKDSAMEEDEDDEGA